MDLRPVAAAAVLLVLPLAASGLRGVESGPASGDVWMQRVGAALEPGRSFSARATLFIRDAEGSEAELALDWARRVEEGGRSLVIEVRQPDFMAGTIFQIVFRSGGEIERRTWDPERGRVETIRGDLATDAFLGSSFTYEDLALAAVPGVARSAVRPVEEEGGPRVLVETGPYHVYSRTEITIDALTDLPVQATFYDLAKFPFRRLRFADVRDVDGHPIPTTVEVEDVLTGARSRLHFERVRLDPDLDPRLFDEDFGRGTLRRGMRIDVPPADPPPGGPAGRPGS